MYFPGTLGGGISSVKASALGSLVIREAIQRAGLKPEDVSEVIMGQVLTAGKELYHT